MTPSKENPKFIHEDGYFGMLVDDSGTVAGRVAYRDHETNDGTKQRLFIETVVEKEYRGAGLAGKIVQHSLDATLDEDLRVVAICPYVSRWIKENDDPRYEAARDNSRPEHFS